MKILDVPQSGSVAGVTSSRNRFGQYRRTRAVPVNPNTAAQSEMRAILAGCSQNWATLTGAQKLAWAAWAALHPRTDSLGQTVSLTGALAFNSVNCLLVMVGLTAVSVPPADPLPDPPVLSLLSLVIAADAWDTAEFAFAPDPVPALTKLLIYSSPPKSAGSYFNGDFRYLTSAAAAAISPKQIGTALTTKWGTPTAGQTFYFRARLLRSDGGFSGYSGIIRGTAEE